MSFSLRQLHYLVAAVAHGNVTRAAAALNVAQPSISAAIAQLEARLGRSLLLRQRGQGVAPTPFGRAFVAKARRVLAEAAELEGLAAPAGEASGAVAVGCFEDLAPYCLPGILKALAAAHPAVSLSLSEGGFDAMARSLAEGALDFAITYDLGLPEGLGRTLLCELAPHALLPAGHHLAAQPRVSLAELAGEPVILTTQPLSWQHFLELFRMRGLEPAASRRVASFETQRGLVAAGLGVALGYTRPAWDRSYDGSRLAVRPLRDELPLQRILLVRPAGLPLSRAGEAAAAATTAWFRRHPLQGSRTAGKAP